MNSTDYDRIIAQERKVLVSINEQGEKFIPEFKRITTSYIRELSIKLIKGYYTHRPEVTRNLGAEKLEEMKRELKEILDTLPEQTSKRLDDSQIWLHRVGIPDHAISDMTYSYQFEKRSNRSMDQAIRDLIGLVGSVLIKYGYIEIGKDFEWKLTPGGIPQFADDLPSKGLDHYKALSKLIEQYKNILVEYVYAIQNLRKAEQAKKSAQADGLWD
ncbi:MAG: hypothetical protein DRI46_00880 [Chloroflexi bacterium]|nr:MAG: hypothetical protein DRI46_00880 [Chloroflexota bacterium]